MRKVRAILLILIGLLPSCGLKRAALRRFFGWEVDDSAWIGISLFMNIHYARFGPHAYIGHGNLFRHLRYLELKEYASIGRWNYITAGEVVTNAEQAGMCNRFVLGRHARMLLRHYISCSGGVEIGALTTLGGIRITMFTHQVDVRTCRVVVKPIKIGSYCLLSANVSVAPGAYIPDRCVIGMGSAVVGELPEAGMLYSGVPAHPVKAVGEGAFFSRTTGPVPHIGVLTGEGLPPSC